MKRKNILVGSFVIALACLVGGVGTVVSKSHNKIVADAASTPKTLDQVSLVMKNGASVRYASSARDSGIRFSVNLSEADYLGLEANEGSAYTSVSYGMMIMPYSYLETYGELTADNLFSDSAVYDWAQWNGSEWVYSGDNTTKKRIISLSYGEMVADKDKAGYYVFSGSMSDVQNENLARDFVGRGYIKAEKADGSTEYIMADYAEDSVHNNVRSIVEVAEKAVADEDVTDQDKVDSLVEYYLDATSVRQVKFYDGNELVAVHKTKKNYTFTEPVVMDGPFSHWVDENGNVVNADSSYEIVGTTKLYAVYEGAQEAIATMNATLETFLATPVTKSNLVALQMQLESLQNAIDALSAGDYKKYVEGETSAAIKAKVAEINTLLADSDELFELHEGVLYTGQDMINNTVAKDANGNMPPYKDGNDAVDSGVKFDCSGTGATDWTVYLPKINYLAFKTVSLQYQGVSTWQTIGFVDGGRVADGGGTLSGTITFTNNGDGTVTCVIADATCGSCSYTITDEAVLNGSKSFTLFWNNGAAYRRMSFGQITATSLYDIWSVDTSATLYTGQNMIDNTVVMDANGNKPPYKDGNNAVDSGVKFDCSSVGATDWTVYLPKVNYLAYQTVSLQYNATNTWQTFGFMNGNRIADGGGAALSGTITFTNNGDGTVTCVISDNNHGSKSYTITDEAVLSGSESFTLFWNQGAGYRTMSFGQITAEVDMNGKIEIAKANGKTPKLVSEVIYTGQNMIDNTVAQDANGNKPPYKDGNNAVDSGVKFDCSGTGATDWNLYLPKINYLAYQTVSLKYQGTSTYQTFGFVNGGRVADGGGASLSGTITFTNNGDGTVTCVIADANHGSCSYTITDAAVLNGSESFTLFWNNGAVYRTFSLGQISATYTASASVSYEEREVTLSAPYVAVTKKVVAEEVRLSFGQAYTELALPLINYSLYEKITFDWATSGWMQAGQGSALPFYSNGDALGGKVTVINNGDGTLSLTMTETNVGQGTHTNTITDSAVVNGQTPLTLLGYTTVNTQTLVATNITVHNGKEGVATSPVEYVLKDFSASTYETTVRDTDAPERGELLVNLYADGERISLSTENVNGGDSTENIYTVTLPWINYSALNYVKTTISTNNGKAIGFTVDDMFTLDQYYDSVSGGYPTYETYLTLTYENGALVATLVHQSKTKTITITDEDLINGKKGFSFYVKGIAYTGYQLTDMIANGKSARVIKNEEQTLDLGVQSGATEYSEYRIAWYASDEWTNDYYNYEFAATELASFLSSWTGKSYRLVKMYDGEVIQPDSKYIVLGGRLAKDAGMTFNGITKSNGYKIVQNYTNLYIYSETSEGTLAGLYGFLKEQADVTFYTDEVFTENVTASSATVEEGMSITFNPSFNVAQAGSAEVQYSQDYQRRLGMYADWYVTKGAALKGASTEWDGSLMTSGHNMLEVFPYETFGSTYSDWYTTVSGTRQLNFTSSNSHLQEMKDMFVASAKVVIANLPQIEYFEFGQPDSQYGPDIAGYLAFMNDVTATLDAWLAVENPDRTIALVMYAYNSTRTAPASGSIYNGNNAYVAVYFAPVGMRYTNAIDAEGSYHKNTDTNSWDNSITIYNSLLSWTRLDGFDVNRNLMYWMYGTDFYNYMMPMDTITNLQHNYQVLAQSGGNLIKYQFQTKDKDNVGSDWQRLKTYLTSELAKDVNADVATLQANFMKAMYGAGATYMQQLLSAQQAYCTYNNFSSMAGAYSANLYFGVINGSAKLLKSGYYTQATLNTWMGYINSAKEAVNADNSISSAEKTEFIERIEVEALSIRYMLIALHGVTTYDASVAAWKVHAASLGCYCYTESGTSDGNW